MRPRRSRLFRNLGQRRSFASIKAASLSIAALLAFVAPCCRPADPAASSTASQPSTPPVPSGSPGRVSSPPIARGVRHAAPAVLRLRNGGDDATAPGRGGGVPSRQEDACPPAPPSLPLTRLRVSGPSPFIGDGPSSDPPTSANFPETVRQSRTIPASESLSSVRRQMGPGPLARRMM